MEFFSNIPKSKLIVLFFLLITPPLMQNCADSNWEKDDLRGEILPEVELPEIDEPTDSDNNLENFKEINLQASKSYKPEEWINAKLDLEKSFYFKLPIKVSVDHGRSGSNWLSLYFRDFSNEYICMYVGDGYKKFSKKECSDNGYNYLFSYCLLFSDFEEFDCESQPLKKNCYNKKLEFIYGERIIESNLFELKVINGDRCETTQVMMNIQRHKISN